MFRFSQLSRQHNHHSRRRQPRKHDTASGESLEVRQLLSATPIAGLSDEFDDVSSIANWQRVNQVEGWNADQLHQWDVAQTQAGRMTMVPNTVVWYQDRRGPMAFENVAGDFVFTTQVHITDRDDIGGSDADDVPGDGDFSLGGVMIRTPRDIVDPTVDWTPGSMADDGTNDGENYIFLSLGYGNAAFSGGQNQFSLEVKTTRNSNSQLELTGLGDQANVVNVQVARIGNSVITLYQVPGQDWQVHRRYTRADMPDTIQVGLVTYTDWEKANDYEPFLHNSTVITPDGFDPTPDQPFNPDLVAGFEFARYVRPDVPQQFAGTNLADPAAISNAELLMFLGEPANVADGADHNSPPTVENVDDQSLLVDTSILVPLEFDDADNDELTVDAVITTVDPALIVVEQQLQVANGVTNYAYNWGGRQEKWLSGNQGWYFLLPDGSLNVWDTNFDSSSELASLPVTMYDDPMTLLNATPFDIAVQFIDGNLQIDAGNQTGPFDVLVVVSDGMASVQTTFQVNVTNTVPVIEVDDQVAVAGIPLVLALPVLDADGHGVTYTVEILGDQLGALDAEYGFWTNGQFYTNYLGVNERWIRDAANQWYFLLPSGALHRWNGSIAGSPLIAQLDAPVYDDPTLLTDPVAPPVFANVENGILTVGSDAGFSGTVSFRVTASDGWDSVADDFSVSFWLPSNSGLFSGIDSLFEEWELLTT
jgi:hypothetical protein